VIYTNSRPIAFLLDYLPEDILSAEELQEGFTGSVLDFLLKNGKAENSHENTNITAIGASHDIARDLQIQRGDVLLMFMSQLFSNHGSVISYSISYFIPGYFHFHVVRRLPGKER